jgi:salicylate hydroxylase
MSGARAEGLPFLIAGGGIGGLAAALAFARAGIPVRVLERASEFREIGAGIQLGPNAFKMFDRLGVADAVLATAVRPEALVMRDALSGEEVIRIPLGGPFVARFGRPYAVTYRADLHETLLDACRAEPLASLETGCHVEDFAEDGPTTVVVRLADGREMRGRALIGADGLWSKIRGKIVGDGPPRVSGHIAFRAVLPVGEVPADLLSDSVVLWAGPRTHLVHYKLRRSELYNLVAVFHSDRYVEGWDAVGDPSELWRHFAGQRPEVLRLLERIETWRMWVLCDREPVRTWTRGRVALLGDAAHPMLQYLAQGAAMAVEDAVRLAYEVIAAGGADGDVAKAFAAYETARYLRTARVQLTARFYGDIYHAAGVTREVRNMLLGERDPNGGYEGVAWLYGGP